MSNSGDYSKSAVSDDGPATNAGLNAPQGIAFAPDSTPYIADTGNDRLRRMATTGTITTV